MNTLYNPERGFFIGKVSKYLISGALLATFVVPTVAKAIITTSITPVDSSIATNASSIIAATGMTGAKDLLLPAINANLVWVTAYASVPGQTDSTPFITASGEHVHDGTIAANWLPFGTKVKIPALFGNKVFTVEDRMNQAFNERADIWMPTVNAAIRFGIQHVTVVVLNDQS